MKILIVNDEAPIRELLKYNLEKEGFSTLQAENAAQAVGFSKLELPDLILLDLMLPDLSGLEVCKILKKDKVTEKNMKFLGTIILLILVQRNLQL